MSDEEENVVSRERIDRPNACILCKKDFGGVVVAPIATAPPAAAARAQNACNACLSLSVCGLLTLALAVVMLLS